MFGSARTVFNVLFSDILNGPVSGIINQFVAKSMSDDVRRSASFFF
jgi:hypothetical protein